VMTNYVIIKQVEFIHFPLLFTVYVYDHQF